MNFLKKFETKGWKNQGINITPKLPRRSKAAAFVMVPLALAARAAKATDGEKLLVWELILHRSWKEKKLTVPATNAMMQEYGIDRWVKLRALRQLEATGLIKVEWRPRKTPLVTVL